MNKVTCRITRILTPRIAAVSTSALTVPFVDSVWSQIASSLGNLRSVFSTNEGMATALKNYVRKLVTPAVEKIGWEFKPEDDYLTFQLRHLLISMAGNSGHEA